MSGKAKVYSRGLKPVLGNSWKFRKLKGAVTAMSRPLCINLTQHDSTPEQEQDQELDVRMLTGAKLEAMRMLLTFNSFPTMEEIQYRAIALADIARNSGAKYAMIGGAGYLMAPLEAELKKRDITPVYSFTTRSFVEVVGKDGHIYEQRAFKHRGWILK